MSSNAAKALWEARIQGGLLEKEALPFGLSEADAYAAQNEQMAHNGLEVAGWKLGATGQAAIDIIKVEGPFLGPVYKDYLAESGAEIAIHEGQPVALETEFTLILGQDIPARETPYTKAEITPLIASICPSFEIVGARIQGGPPGIANLAIVDGGLNKWTVLGKPVTNFADFPLETLSATTDINGERVAEGSNQNLFWEHPIDGVVWLANHSAMKSRGLKAGELVMTGTLSGLLPIKIGDFAEARYGDFGSISAKFVAAD